MFFCFFPVVSSIDESQDRSVAASFQPAARHLNEPPEGNAAGIQCGFGHCPWLLYQLAATVRGKQFTATSMITLFSNLPGQYLKARASTQS